MKSKAKGTHPTSSTWLKHNKIWRLHTSTAGGAGIRSCRIGKWSSAPLPCEILWLGDTGDNHGLPPSPSAHLHLELPNPELEFRLKCRRALQVWFLEVNINEAPRVDLQYLGQTGPLWPPSSVEKWSLGINKSMDCWDEANLVSCEADVLQIDGACM